MHYYDTRGAEAALTPEIDVKQYVPPKEVCLDILLKYYEGNLEGAVGLLAQACDVAPMRLVQAPKKIEEFDKMGAKWASTAAFYKRDKKTAYVGKENALTTLAHEFFHHLVTERQLLPDEDELAEQFAEEIGIRAIDALNQRGEVAITKQTQTPTTVEAAQQAIEQATRPGMDAIAKESAALQKLGKLAEQQRQKSFVVPLNAEDYKAVQAIALNVQRALKHHKQKARSIKYIMQRIIAFVIHKHLHTLEELTPHQLLERLRIWGEL